MPAATEKFQQDMSTLYSEHHGWLSGWLRQRLGCAHHAADVAQDTFLRLLAARDLLPTIKEPRAYLTTTAQRLLIDRNRRQVIEQAYMAELAHLAEHLPVYPSPDDMLQALQALERIAAALETVSHKVRSAFLLHYLEGRTHAAIAAQLKVSTRMVQKYLIQALLQCDLALDA